MRSQDVLGSFLGPAGAYLHVPFCETICPFCPYNKVLYQQGLVQRYFAALGEEVQAYVERLEKPFTSLYIGGGTPSLCLEELAPVIAMIPVTGERAMELLPTHVTPDRLDALERMGVSYVSLGAQSFDAGMLRHLGRRPSVEDNRRALDLLAGRFACVDVDLIFDVAFEDEAVFLRDVETCFAAGVEQVSTYPLMRFGYTPFGKARHARHAEHAALRKAEEIAARYGYERRSVWTFNRMDAPNYTSITRDYYLGMGAGAASYTGRRFLVNHFSVERYIDDAQAGALPIARAFSLPPFLSSAYGVFWQAYTGHVNMAAIQQGYGVPAAAFWRATLAALALARRFERRGDVFTLTARGRDQYHDLERWVTYHFIEPLWAEMMREHYTKSEESGEAKALACATEPGASWLREPKREGFSAGMWRGVAHAIERKVG